jgi:hypothetical protein
MAPNPAIVQAVEKLGYRVTVGDVAAQSGLEINFAQQGLLALASDAGGHLQVADTGEIVYLFPRNFRDVLRNKFLRLQLQEWWEKIWKVLFYLIRISFGIILVASIILIYVAIAIIIVASLFSNDNNDSGSRSSGNFNFIWIPDFWWIFTPDYDRRYSQSYQTSAPEEKKMNFLEAVFSFLFGDGNPNADLEKRRWFQIGTVIRNQRGAVAAEQIAPYLDEIGPEYSRDSEDYMLPVLTKFNGVPEVSPVGDIVYHFPELQTTAAGQGQQSVGAYLREKLWQFSSATSGQIALSIGLGAVNIVGALVLMVLLRGALAAKFGSLVGFVGVILGVLLVYGVGFLVIPAIRYFWIQYKNRQIEARNQQRQERAVLLGQATPEFQNKLAYARQFAAQKVIGQEDLVYTTENELLDQQLQQSDRIDEEWRRRLERG